MKLLSNFPMKKFPSLVTFPFPILTILNITLCSPNQEPLHFLFCALPNFLEYKCNNVIFGGKFIFYTLQTSSKLILVRINGERK